jgi:hypothetical protein
MYVHFWPELFRCLKTARKPYTTPYDWDHPKTKFTIIKTPKYVKVFKLMSYLSFLHMIIMLWNLIRTLQKEKTFLPKMISLDVAACTGVILICRWMHYKRAEEIVHFLNCMVESAASPVTEQEGKFHDFSL